MAAKGNKCCCCGECKGVVGCCSCACKTLCFSIEGAYKTHGAEADWIDDEFAATLETDDGEVNVSVTFEQNDYGCFVIGNEDGYEKVRYEVGVDISCNALAGTIPTSVGDVDFVCTVKVQPECTTCDCLCECICIIVRDFTNPYGGEYIYAGKGCWDQYTQEYTGTVDEQTQTAPNLTREVRARIRPNEYDGTCEMIVYVDGEESAVVPLTLDNCTRREFSHEVDILDEDDEVKYTVLLRCAECHEECDLPPNLCFCPGRVVTSITATMFSGLVTGPLGVVTLTPSFICMDLCQSAIKIAGECQAFEGELTMGFPVGMGETVEDTIQVRLFCRVGEERYFQYRFTSAVEAGSPGWTNTGAIDQELFRCGPTFFDMRSAGAGSFGVEDSAAPCEIDPLAVSDAKTVYQLQEFVLEEA